MEYESDNISRRDKVLAQFRASLSRPITDRFFDEDFLIDVFDYAGDIGDDYIRMEVLLTAARFYPESEELKQRKAIFYYQYSDDIISQYIEDSTQEHGMMWDIMRARKLSIHSDTEKQALLTEIATKYDNYNDEETIQLITLASAFHQYDWIKDNLDLLRQRVSYVNILLYEIAVAAETNNDLPFAVEMLEELTELEPFNHYFWLMLSRTYETIDNDDKALNAIEYALAINPDDVPSLLTKAKLMFKTSDIIERFDDIVNILKRAIALNPNDPEAVRLMSNAYSDTGHNQIAIKVLQDFLDTHPDQISEVIRDLVVLRPDNLDDLLDKYFIDNKESGMMIDNAQFMWSTWAHHLSHFGYSDVSERIINAFERNSGLHVVDLYTIEKLFNEQRFAETIMNLSDYLTSGDHNEIDFPTITVIHLISMIKLGEYDHAEDFIDFIESNSLLTTYNDISHRLEYIGMMKIIRQIKSKLKRTKDPKDWEKFDPLKMW